ncbi:MAG TPA: hypothetical protein VFX02_08170 [Gammaproteobacteria bacterium]|nr:hypothetical protein [Gammaproteobacteria bacterium]
MAAILDEPLMVKRMPLISWGAIFAGLFFVITASWLLFLLGSAIGVGIADASDMQALQKGFGAGAAAWLIVTTVVVYYLGAWLAARLAGNPDKGNGLLYGLVVWSAVGVLILLLGSWGVSNAMQAGQSLLSGVATAAKSAAQGAGNAGSAAANAASSNPQFVNDIQALIKQRMADAVAQAGTEAAAEAPQGGPAPTQEQLRQAIENMDTATLAQVTRQLVAGNTQGAKNALAANTNLSPQQIDTLINGASQAVNERVNQAKQQFGQTVEKVSDYTQGLIWAMFFSSLLGLGGALFGGAMGSRGYRRSTTAV